jgi:hypothetical protein
MIRRTLLVGALAALLLWPVAAYAQAPGDTATLNGAEYEVIAVWQEYAVIRAKPTPTPTPAPESPSPEPTPEPTSTPEPTPTPTPTPEPPPAPTPTPDSEPVGEGLLVTDTQLAALPTSGSNWDHVTAKANEALAQITFSASGAATDCQLRNYENVGRYGQKILAAALVAARTGDATMRALVQRCLRYVIGTEDRASTDGTSSDDGLLSTARNLAAYVVAADLIGFDKNLTGSRAGWTGTSWETWLRAILDKPIGSHGRWTQIRATSVDSASNWGAAALMSRTAVELYLGAPSFSLVAQWRRWMGDASSGLDFNVTSGYNATWACRPDGETGPAGTLRRPINPPGCGDTSGVVVEDASRGGDCCGLVDEGISYSNEHLHFVSAGARMMRNRGFDVATWRFTRAAGSTLAAAGDYGLRKGLWPLYGTHQIHGQLAHQMNDLLGTSYPEVAVPAPGRAVSYADWWGRRSVP